jgi:hydroxymethylpyrimidine pyrophosphatase-like HAD family hydrolase
MIVTDHPPRLIATDLDGTLVLQTGRAAGRRALSALGELGIELVFVTARPPRWVDRLADVVGAHGTVICGNGAFIYDVLRRAVIRAHGISPATMRAIAADLRAELPGVGFAAELPDGMRMEREYPVVHQEDIPADDAYRPIDAIREPAGKLLARSLQIPDAEFLSRVVRLVGGRAEVT